MNERLPYDPQRLAAIQSAADSAFATTGALSRLREELREALGRLLHHPEREQMKRHHNGSPASPWARMEREIEQIRRQIATLDEEARIHHERTAGIGALADACARWARHQIERGGISHADA